MENKEKELFDKFNEFTKGKMNYNDIANKINLSKYKKEIKTSNYFSKKIILSFVSIILIVSLALIFIISSDQGSTIRYANYDDVYSSTPLFASIYSKETLFEKNNSIKSTNNFSIESLENIDCESLSKLFNSEYDDSYLINHFYALVFSRDYEFYNKKLLDIEYNDLFIENGEIYVTLSYDLYKENGKNIKSHFIDLILIPKEWKDIINYDNNYSINFNIEYNNEKYDNYYIMTYRTMIEFKNSIVNKLNNINPNEIFIIDAYGEFNGCLIVTYSYEGYVHKGEYIEITEVVEDKIFNYSIFYPIVVYKDNYFYTITDAYNNKLLSLNNLNQIDKLYEDHVCEYVFTTIDPTCEEPGVKYGKCQCGKIIDSEVIPATGHNYIDGVCSCGKVDDNIMQDCYNITLNGKIEYLKNNIANNARQNDKIVIETQVLIDADIEVYVNNVKINKIINNEDNETWLYEFIMPDNDVLIEIKVVTIEYYNVTFNSNDGVLISGSETQVVSSLDNIIYPIYEKEGYLIKDYFINKNSTSNIIIDVIWERNPNLYKLEVYLESSLYFIKYYAYDEMISIDLPTKDDYTLIYDKDVPTKMPKEDVIINLSWQKEFVYMYVHYYSDQLPTVEYKYKYGDTVYEPDLSEYSEMTKYGYTFGGYEIEFPFVIYEDMDVETIWIPKKMTLQFDGVGADYLEFDEMEIEYEGNLILPNVSKEGYNFEGWYYYSEHIKNGEWKRLYNNDIVLTAKWSYALEYYEFGRYPQTHVSDLDLISQLNNLQTVNSKGYYELNGEEYCKIDACPVVENELYYSDGSVAINGVEWFKVEPIKWIVSGENSYSLTPMYLLDVSAFDLENVPYSDSYYRYYLNNTFLNLAFTSEEIEKLIPISNAILEFTVSGNSVTTVLSNVKDKVFAKSTNYGGGKVELTDYALAKGASLTKSTNNATNISKYYGNWWVYEQYQVSNINYKNTYYYAYKDEFAYADANKMGICINMTIRIELD